MNKKIVTLAIILALPLTAAACPGGDGDGFHRNRGDRLERLTQELNLSTEQKDKLDVIFKEQRQKAKAIHQETRQQIQEVLNSEQQAQYEALKKQRHEQWQKRHDEHWKNKKTQGETQE
ncbi:MAG: hypothetical protein CVV13_07060 [Gammaproteobacteria bacterium HGW-Gammaproteobacteria-3]|jgi:Spy/CpxP family protein refolding chaperone|nr:MAG: hypothetical protein CVV13_07060 [Gammaproteobacteria bacterium HGW-Gammaproteobacteria-3]